MAVFNLSEEGLKNIGEISRPGDLHSAVIRAEPPVLRYPSPSNLRGQDRLMRLAAFQARADRARKLKPRKRYEEL